MRPALWIPRFGASLVLLVMVAPAHAQSSISRFTVDGGGGWSAAGVFEVGGTIGQPDAGQSSAGIYTLKGGFWLGGLAISAVDGPGVGAGVRETFRLQAAYPNPLVRRSVIAFAISKEGPVRLRVFDATGRLARTVSEETLPVGDYERAWDGTDDAGRPVANGIYFIALESQSQRATRKLVVLR